MKRIVYISIVFIALVVLYFSPIQLPSKLAYPVAFLGLMALIDHKHMCMLMALGLVFSALGDWQGTQGNFLGQMGCFGLAHIAYISYFVSRLKNKVEWKNVPGYTISTPIILGGLVMMLVVPLVPAGIIRIGVIIYSLLILSMLSAALLQRDWIFDLGAALFVCSDFILAWNKFVTPIHYASWFIMVPYYSAQWLLFYRATSVASSVLQKIPHSSQK